MISRPHLCLTGSDLADCVCDEKLPAHWFEPPVKGIPLKGESPASRTARLYAEEELVVTKYVLACVDFAEGRRDTPPVLPKVVRDGHRVVIPIPARGKPWEQLEALWVKLRARSRC